MFTRDSQGCGHDPWDAGLGTKGRGGALRALPPLSAHGIWGKNSCTQLSSPFLFCQ